MRMKNKKSLLFSIVLFLMNTAGAVGALLTVVLQEWTAVLNQGLFFCGLLLLCAFTVVFWLGGRRRSFLVRSVVLLAVYCAVLLLFRKTFLNSLAWALSSTVSRLDERYGIVMIWGWTMERDAVFMERAATLGILAVLLPYLLLLGYGMLRSHVLAVVLADAVWFIASCGLDEFPEYRFLIPCVLGLGAVVVRKAYRESERAAMAAVLLDLAVLGIIMMAVWRFLLPVFDKTYEEILEDRVELSRLINEEWIPQIQSVFSFGPGAGGSVDVTGELARENAVMYTWQEIYRVTLNEAPERAVYLRGFVGKDYAGDRWRADRDASLTNYYKERGWELPESGRILVNMTHEAFRNGAAGFVRVEELAGAGSYSLYPFGAELPAEYRVHWDQTAERKSSQYQFPYYAPEGYQDAKGLAGDMALQESRYREYVYDTFCEYPQEQFPALTALLEESALQRGSVYDCVTEALAFLRQRAVYNLDVGSQPSGEDFVEYFLLESHQGYCAHFASAGVLILRYLGVPARYAAGYTASADTFSRDEDGNYTAVLTDMQAHAWTEVYLDGVGWIPVEMTPGAVAFTEDNSMEQLELSGQLSGAFSQGDIPEQIETAGEPKEDELPGALPEDELPEPVKKPVGRPGEQFTGEGENQEERPEGNPGGTLPKMKKGQKLRRSEVGSAFWQSEAFRIFLLCFLVSSGFVLLVVGTARLARNSCRRRFGRAGNREKVFLLYRNLRRLLWVAGNAGRLKADDEAACAFRLLLEKSSFGEHAPEEEELREARDFFNRLVREEYGGLPAYKKPFYRCLRFLYD